MLVSFSLGGEANIQLSGSLSFRGRTATQPTNPILKEAELSRTWSGLWGWSNG